MGNAILGKPIIKPGEPINAFVETGNENKTGSTVSSGVFKVLAKETDVNCTKFVVVYTDGSSRDRLNADYYSEDKNNGIITTPYLSIENVTSGEANTGSFDAINVDNRDIFAIQDTSTPGDPRVYIAVVQSENPDRIIRTNIEASGSGLKLLYSGGSGSDICFWLAMGNGNNVSFYGFSIENDKITLSKTVTHEMPRHVVGRQTHDYRICSDGSYAYVIYQTKKSTTVDTNYVIGFSYDENEVVAATNQINFDENGGLQGAVCTARNSFCIIYNNDNIYHVTHSDSVLSLATTIGEIPSSHRNIIQPICSASIEHEAGLYNYDSSSNAIRYMYWSGNTVVNQLCYGPNISTNHTSLPTWDNLSDSFVTLDSDVTTKNQPLGFYRIYTYPGSAHYKIMKYKDKLPDTVSGKYCVLAQ